MNEAGVVAVGRWRRSPINRPTQAQLNRLSIKDRLEPCGCPSGKCDGAATAAGRYLGFLTVSAAQGPTISSAK
jgi:hypothetical protein